MSDYNDKVPEGLLNALYAADTGEQKLKVQVEIELNASATCLPPAGIKRSSANRLTFEREQLATITHLYQENHFSCSN